ncbi:MAG TPA: hypothetical protein PK876_05875 [Elusimicrobiota bacterium]|nr:hypothetical protein [Elusimicrobiota bacterium]
MLSKIRQDVTAESSRNGARREWYHSENGDLFVWRRDRDIVSFQISCLSLFRGERNECWGEWDGRSFRTGFVNSKEVDGREHDIKTPVVDVTTADSSAIRKALAGFLQAEGAGLPSDVLGRLTEHLRSTRRASR